MEELYEITELYVAVELYGMKGGLGGEPGQRVKSNNKGSPHGVDVTRIQLTPRRQKACRVPHVCVLKLELSDKCYFQKHEWETSRLKNLKSQGFE